MAILFGVVGEELVVGMEGAFVAVFTLVEGVVVWVVLCALRFAISASISSLRCSIAPPLRKQVSVSCVVLLQFVQNFPFFFLFSIAAITSGSPFLRRFSSMYCCSSFKRLPMSSFEKLGRADIIVTSCERTESRFLVMARSI